MDKLILTQPLQNKWQSNLLMFLKPIVVLYIVAITGVITMNGGVVKLTDFIPNEFTLGGATLYILNAALDYFNKLKV